MAFGIVEPVQVKERHLLARSVNLTKTLYGINKFGLSLNEFRS